MALPGAAWANADKADKAAKMYDDALARYEKGDLSGAAVQLKNVLQVDKKMLSAHLLLGRVLLRAGELKAAEASLELALQQGVSKVEVAPLLGQVYLQLGESKKLLDTITTAGMPQHLHADILTQRGTAMAMSGNLNGASALFAQARELDPKAAGPLIAEAPILLRIGDRDKARSTSQRATELAPDNPSAWYQHGTIAHALGDNTAAMAAFDKALALNAKHVDARVSRASVLVGLNRDAEAAKELDQLKEWKAVEPRASFLRGILATRRGDTKLAKEEFTQATALIDAMPPPARNGSEPLLLSGAIAHRHLGQLEKAREYLDALLSRNNRHYAATLMLAGVYLDSREFNRAQPMVDALQRAAPDDPQVLYMVGALHMAKRQFQQATEAFEKASARGATAESQRELGLSQLSLGRNQQGVAQLEKVLAANPADYRAGVELATFYARNGNGARAVQIAESLVKVDPNNVAMINFVGNIKGRLRDMQGAGEAFKAAIAKDPKYRPAVMNLSWLDMDERRFDDARNRLLAFIKTHREDPDLLFQLGVLEERARRPNEALTYWRKADQMQKQDPRPALAIIEMLAGQRQGEQALAAAKALNARMPNQMPVTLSLARAYLATGDNLLARQTLLEATKLAGFDAEPLVLIGRMYLQAGYPDGAAHNVNKALQSAPNDLGALILAVETAARRADTAGMDTAMAALAAKHPGKPGTLVTMANIAMSRGQFAKASAHYAQALEREPSTPLTLMLTQAHVAAKEPQKALSLLEAWTRRNPNDRVALRALAEVQMLNGRNDSAKRSYQAIVASDPDDPDALAAYAQLLHRLDDPAAVTTAERAVKLAPNNPMVLDAAGWLLVQRGQVDAGLRHLRDARLREPANGAIRFHLATALAKAGKRIEARDELGAALASGAAVADPADMARLKAELGL